MHPDGLLQAAAERSPAAPGIAPEAPELPGVAVDRLRPMIATPMYGGLRRLRGAASRGHYPQ
jgi:hypothetical protein